MRVLFCALLLLVGACGQNNQKAETPGDAPAATVELGPVVARGEPGWRLDIDRQQGMALSAGQGGQTWAAAYAPAHRTAQGYRIASGALTVELENGGCVAAGETYPMRAQVRTQGGQTLSGCAAVRWDGQLLALMPRIDACIAAAPEARRVTYAGDDGDGAYLVRLWSQSGGVDCRVSSSNVAQIAPRSDDLRIGGEHEAIFVRGPGRNPGGQCFTATEVRSADGELLGWMDDPQGC
ncbi:MAG: hypothetical protein ACREH4_09755 [Vitreimonas sp.]